MRKKFIVVLITLFCISISSASEMVQISVEVTEIDNNKALNLGINWVNGISFQDVPKGVTDINKVVSGNAALANLYDINTLGDITRTTAIKADVNFLQEKGAAQILSKPKLVTKSGTQARAFIGGEFPVIPPSTSSAGGSGSISWKQYGIILEILPNIVNGGKEIDLSLKNTVSRLDWVNAVQSVPALVTRETSSFVKVKPGQTITIAGLVQTQDSQTRSGLPLLGSIPILGYLFSYKTVKKTKTTILIFVTPEIID